MKIKILELFSGYGTATFALKKLNIHHRLVGYSDIDKYANQCFKQNHCPEDTENKLQLGDVKQINPYDLEDFDLLTGGFPCQAFSLAGKMEGELDPRGTLFYEIIRIAEVKQPKYMLLENVKGLTTKKFKDTFSKILSELNRIHYNVYWKVLNSKDFGIPQSRARVWFVCIRKDIDEPFKFQFPQPEPLNLFIKDILEQEVDEKYYLSEKLQERFKEYLELKNTKTENDQPTIINFQPQGENSPCMLKAQEEGRSAPRGSGILTKNDGTTYCLDVNCTQGVVMDFRNDEGFRIRKENISPCLARSKCSETDLSQSPPLVAISNSSKREMEFKEEISPTLCARDYKDPKIVHNLGRLRRLTPTECFRLMGFLKDEINLDSLSDTQKYKLAGNGQDLNMVTQILNKLLGVKND